MINAEVNGSCNIMLLLLEKQNVKLDVIEEILRPENKRFVLNPVRICAYKYKQKTKLTIINNF